VVQLARISRERPVHRCSCSSNESFCSDRTTDVSVSVASFVLTIVSEIHQCYSLNQLITIIAEVAKLLDRLAVLRIKQSNSPTDNGLYDEVFRYARYPKTDLTKSSIVQIIYCIFGWKRILFTNTLAVYALFIVASFFCIYISQDSVTTQLMCGGIFNNHFIANCLQNVPVKKILKIG